jgi:hypothetical protein
MLQGQYDDMDVSMINSDTARARWLILAHQLPAKPAYQRVKVWRSLQAIGALNLKNAFYVLPASVEARAALTRILRDVERAGGEGIVSEAELVAGMRDDEMRRLFNNAREADYREFAASIRKLLQGKGRSRKSPLEASPVLVKLRQRLADIRRIDFFDASGRAAVEALLTRLEHSHLVRQKPPAKEGGRTLKGKTWVTRQDIHVDRIACAWLITRFIDPQARLKFVAGGMYAPGPDEYRYDMKDGEFTHEGEDCSFEVLLRRARIQDPALKTIGEVVHDIDIQDGKFGRPQAAGIAHVISGICRTQGSDEARVEKGRELFDSIYEQFRRQAKSRG